MSVVKVPKVFISYSWTSPEHQDWVVTLAERLVTDGVDVILDKWDLQPGQDLNDFMEQMVKSADIDKVLVICDAEYADRADGRRGGVGTETQIISPKVYGDVRQEKFVPIIAEVDAETGKACVPIYLRGRTYIDMSSEEKYEIGYESLLRNLLDRPAMRKPKLGTPPSYLFEDAPNFIKTGMQIKQLTDAVKRGNGRVDWAKQEFIDGVGEELGNFVITAEEFRSAPIPDELIMSKFTDMIELRNQIVEYVETLCKYEADVDIDSMVELMQCIHKFTYAGEGETSYFDEQRDNFRLFAREIFIYIVAVFIGTQRYVSLAQLLRATYWLDRRHESETAANYTSFNFHVRLIDERRNNRLGLRRYSLSAEELLNRATLSRYPKRKLVQADVTLYLLGCLMSDDFPWYPRSSPYEHGTIPLFHRLRSRRHFDKVKDLFGVSTPEQLKMLIKQVQYPRYTFGGFFPMVISNHIDPDDIATVG